MGKKSDAAEIDRRIHMFVVKMLASAKTSSYVIRFCSEEWGWVSEWRRNILPALDGVIKADYSIERSDFLGSRLALLDKIIQASIASKQHSNAVGALKLQAQLTRLLESR